MKVGFSPSDVDKIATRHTWRWVLVQVMLITLPLGIREGGVLIGVMLITLPLGIRESSHAHSWGCGHI